MGDNLQLQSYTGRHYFGFNLFGNLAPRAAETVANVCADASEDDKEGMCSDSSGLRFVARNPAWRLNIETMHTVEIEALTVNGEPARLDTFLGLGGNGFFGAIVEPKDAALEDEVEQTGLSDGYGFLALSGAVLRVGNFRGGVSVNYAYDREFGFTLRRVDEENETDLSKKEKPNRIDREEFAPADSDMDLESYENFKAGETVITWGAAHTFWLPGRFLYFGLEPGANVSLLGLVKDEFRNDGYSTRSWSASYVPKLRFPFRYLNVWRASLQGSLEIGTDINDEGQSQFFGGANAFLATNFAHFGLILGGNLKFPPAGELVFSDSNDFLTFGLWVRNPLGEGGRQTLAAFDDYHRELSQILISQRDPDSYLKPISLRRAELHAFHVLPSGTRFQYYFKGPREHEIVFTHHSKSLLISDTHRSFGMQVAFGYDGENYYGNGVAADQMDVLTADLSLISRVVNEGHKRAREGYSRLGVSMHLAVGKEDSGYVDFSFYGAFGW